MADKETAARPAGNGPVGNERVRAPGLDGVRALAVLAVFAFHLGMGPAPGGFLGVDVFFVLSGYLITDLLVARQARNGHLAMAGFWVRRARRLLPALAVVLIAVTAATALIEPSQLPDLRSALLAAVTYSSNWYQVYHHVSYFAAFGPPPPLQHLWSLAIEEQFYLAWPLLLFVLLHLRQQRVRAAVTWACAGASAIAMALLYTPGADPSRVYYGTDTHATALLAGSALALTIPLAGLTSAGERLTRRLDVLGIAGLALLGWALGHDGGSDPALYPYGLVLAALAATALTAAAAVPGSVSTLLSIRPLRWIGVRSYGIYLWHWPVIALTAALAGTERPPPWLWPSDVALAIALAAASWRWIERPILTNGFGATCAATWRSLQKSVTTARGSPAQALPAVLAVGACAIVGTAGYGVLRPAPPPAGLQAQILRGEQVSARTRAQSPAARRASGHPSPAALPTTGPVTGRNVTAIGDSVMAAGAMALQHVLPGIYIDAKPDRQMSAGLVLVRHLLRAGRLRPVVVMGLGTNYLVTTAQLRELLRLLGPHRKLVLINTYVPDGWSKQVNATDAAFARAHPAVVLADWYDTIRDRLYLLWPDHIHPQLPGTFVYARMVYRAVQATRAVPGAAPTAPVTVRAAHGSGGSGGGPR